jgi:hypothetical protein
MKTKILFIMIVAVLMAGAANAQMKVAVLDFKAGVGVAQGDVDGISAIFGTYFIDPQKFTLVERTQIDKTIAEQGFQYSALTNQQMVKIGQILNIQKIVVGDVNIMNGQYNVDVRMVNVETGAVDATEGATWAKGTSYRELMKGLATRLMGKTPTTTYVDSRVTVLLGYLYVFPEDLGVMTVEEAYRTCVYINSAASYGFSDWLLPTIEEMKVVLSNGEKVPSLKNAKYMTRSEEWFYDNWKPVAVDRNGDTKRIYSQDSFNVRLVRTNR